MQFPAFSTDLFIILTVLIVGVYGVVGGQGALIRETISAYVGIVLAATFGGPLYEFSKAQAGGSLPFEQSVINLMLLILPILILQIAHRRHHVRQHSSMIITLILAVLAALLLISSVIAQLSPLTISRITEESNLAAQIYNFKLAWLGLVPVAIAASAIFNSRSQHKK